MISLTSHGLDAFQLMISFYLFFTAIKGKGTLYNFPEIPKIKLTALRNNLRTIYAAGGFICLLDGASSILQHSMFTTEYTETGVNIIQNYSLDGFPFITYELLSMISTICIGMILILLFGVIIYTRRQRR